MIENLHITSKGSIALRAGHASAPLLWALDNMEILPLDQKIQPHKVTKPIQLLAAWMVGLIVTNATFLAAATYLSPSAWERGALVIAAIVNVPLFIGALFLLQTRFRAELQEDHFYFEYLSKKTASLIRVDKNIVQGSRLEALEREAARSKLIRGEDEKSSNGLIKLDWSNWRVALNQLHPRFDELREALRSADIPLAEFFGNEGNSPSEWVISLSNSLPANHKAAILRVVVPFEFEGFSFWDPIEEADETEDVYIGSYGKSSFARIDDKLQRLLEKDVEEVDLRHYYSRHLVISSNV